MCRSSSQFFSCYFLSTPLPVALHATIISFIILSPFLVAPLLRYRLHSHLPKHLVVQHSFPCLVAPLLRYIATETGLLHLVARKLWITTDVANGTRQNLIRVRLVTSRGCSAVAALQERVIERVIEKRMDMNYKVVYHVAQ